MRGDFHDIARSACREEFDGRLRLAASILTAERVGTCRRARDAAYFADAYFYFMRDDMISFPAYRHDYLKSTMMIFRFSMLPTVDARRARRVIDDAAAP